MLSRWDEWVGKVAQDCCFFLLISLTDSAGELKPTLVPHAVCLSSLPQAHQRTRQEPDNNKVTNITLPHIPMPLPPPRFPLHTRLLELLHLRHALPIHPAILPNQPAAQDPAEDRHHQAHGGRDPHAFAVQRALGGWEDVGACSDVSLRQERKGKKKAESHTPPPKKTKGREERKKEAKEKINPPSKGPHCPTVASTVYPPARLDSVA